MTAESEFPHLEQLSNSLAHVVEQAARSLVRVEGRRGNPASGVVYSADGLIITAHHVLERDDSIGVVLPGGETVQARLVGRDPASDLALLRVPKADLEPLAHAGSGEAKIGHLVLAVARPYEVAASVGIISTNTGPWRTWRGGRVERLVQTDATFYPGFSGGALVDTAGRMLGVLSSQLGRGLNLAVPVDIAQRVVGALQATGRVRRAYLGVGTQPVELPERLRQGLGLTQATGLLVVTLEPNGPADQAGLLVGDIIIGLAGYPIESIDTLQEHLQRQSVGSATTIRLVRGGSLVEPTATLGERQEASAGEAQER